MRDGLADHWLNLRARGFAKSMKVRTRDHC
jgi:hypothetical protein